MSVDEYEFKAFLCGMLTVVTAVVIVRDLVVERVYSGHLANRLVLVEFGPNG